MRKSLAAIIAAAAVAQLWLAYRYYGFLTGDDVEVLSEAFRRARGLDFHPWDVRNLFVPDVFVAPFVWLAHGASTRTTIFIASLPFVALTSLTIVLVFRLTLRWSSDERAAIVAALLFATHWIPLGFGSTVYPRTLATLCVVAAALIVDRWPSLAGALIGIAFADRFSEVVFIAPLALTVILSRRYPGGVEDGEGPPAASRVSGRGSFDRPQPLPGRRRLRMTAVGGAVAFLLTVGMYDYLTWGKPFASVINFARLTLVAPDFASRVKYQAPWWYLANIARWCSLAMLPLLWFGRRSRAIWFVVIPLIVFSAIKHKELRYLQVLIPFLCIAAAIGFAGMRNRRIAVALVAISLLWDLHGLRYFARKSQPAVMAAQWIAANPSIRSIAAPQLWAFGDKLYLGDRIGMTELGTPPQHLESVRADAVAMYETDLDVPSRVEALRANGYGAARTFRDDPARAVVVFLRNPSDTLDRGRR